MATIEINPPSVPIVANVSALPINSPTDLRRELYEQIFRTLNWLDSVRYSVNHGADSFIEIGHGNVLTRLIKSINQSVPRMNVQDTESLEATVSALSQ